MLIMTKTPFRVSLVGGGTDLPSFYRNHDYGAVVSLAIDKYMYIMVNQKFDDFIRVSYSTTEIVTHPDDIQHPLVRECLKRMNIKKGIEIVSVADIPGQGTGLGSSSAFTVGLLNALIQFCVYHDIDFEPLTDLAEEACKIEIERCGAPIGKQDQYAAAYGGVNYFKFLADETVEIERFPLKPEVKRDLERHLMLFYIGNRKPESEILTKQTKFLDENDQNTRLRHLAMRQYAETTAEYMRSGTIDHLGYLLHENWMMKREIVSGIETGMILKYYENALDAGAEGGKVLGAGGGGFMLFFAPPEKQEAVRTALDPLRYVSFRISEEGSRLVYMEGLSRT